MDTGIEKKTDVIPLAKGLEFKRGEGFLNDNVLVVGATGSGKTTSVAYPRIMSTYESSLVIPSIKGDMYSKYKDLLLKRGYEVKLISFSSTLKSSCCYDPLFEKNSEESAISLAEAMMGGKSRSLTGEYDPYWDNATMSAIAALLMLSQHLSKGAGGFEMFLRLFKELKVYVGSCFSTSLDEAFEEMGRQFPSSSAPRMWKTFITNAPKTASCIYSMMSSSVDKLMLGETFKYEKKKPYFSVSELGRKKVALFVSTSYNTASKKACDILYWDIIRTLMADAEANGGSLDVPVQILADDFACGSVVAGFDSFISSFRQAGISATIILQSLSQLESMYGKASAQTIRDNCDTMVFFGSTDVDTCKVISSYLDVPISEVFRMPPEKCAVIRRGSRPAVLERCSIAVDKEYSLA